MPNVGNFFIDLGLAALLLLAGQWARMRFTLIQRLFLPASVIGGLLGLALGPNGLSVLPLSATIATYPGILIAFIFASLPFASQKHGFRSRSRAVWQIWSYSTLFILLQWGFGLLFAMTILRWLWPQIHMGFGVILASGFVGGHGSAAAIGNSFADLGWQEAGSLAMTSATAGIFVAVVGGMIWIQLALRNNWSPNVRPFDDLPQSLRTGLVPKAERKAIGEQTLSPVSIDPLIWHFSLIAIAALIGYYFGQAVSPILGVYRLPLFCLAYLAALLIRFFLRKMSAESIVDRRTMVRLCGSLTDLLVVYGIASINIALLIKYVWPLAAVLLVGVVVCAAVTRFLGPVWFGRLWFEKSLFTWGWVTGITALAIALLRIVDPDSESNILDDFAIAYVAIAPIEIALLTLVPVLIVEGFAWAVVLLTAVMAFVLVLLALAKRKG